MSRLPSITLPRISDRKSSVIQAPNESSRCRKKMPFHIPHKKILEKMDIKIDLPEPLTGFNDSQNKRIRRDSIVGKQLSSIEPFASKHKKTTHLRSIVTTMDHGDGSERRDTILERSESVVLNELRRKPVVANLNHELEKMKKARKFTFIYMSYAVPKESIYFNPYCLIIVPYQQLNLKNYMTMSPYGVTHYTTEQIFTKLPLWEYEYKMFCSLKEIKFFRVFRMWKAFYMWRKTIVYKKYTSSRRKLQKNLFALNFVFGRCLLRLQERNWIMYHQTFAELSLHEDTPLYYFIENQMERLEHIQNHLKDFNKIILTNMQKTCYTGLMLEGFDIHDELEYLTMTYTDKAKKRDFCGRIGCFIKLIDYMTIHMLHCLMKRSYNQMAEMFRYHFDATPSDELLTSLETDTVLEEVPRETLMGQWPLIQVELYISDEFKPVLDPPLDITLEIFTKIVNLWDTTIYSMKRFQLEECFARYYEQSGGDDMNIKAVLELEGYILNQDKDMLLDRKFLIDFFSFGYGNIVKYLERFKQIWLLYKEDVETDVNVLKENRELSILKTLCIRYRNEIKLNERISSYQTLGVIFLCLLPMKEKLIAQPSHLFQILAQETPSVGRDMVQGVIDACDKVNNDLNTDPETSVEIIEYNTMLNGIEEVVVKLEEQLEYIRELYDMMGEYGMIIPPEDMQEYLGLGQVLASLRGNCDRVLESRERLSKKFNTQINTDIDLLYGALVVIKQDVVAPWLLDINSDANQVINVLDQMSSDIQTHIETYKQIQEWQRVFKMHVTRIDLIAEVSTEVQLRQLLWKSHMEWGGLRESWYTTDFNELNLEEVQTTTVNYGKTINKIEKSLPPNKIVPGLRESVEDMKSKLVIITYLKNPALKPRHWMQIESILNTRFTIDTVLTLELLEGLGVFNNIEEITEISGLASSEESLEALLKKIESIWKVLELPVLQYRDYKDIFMLGSLEDVQAAIDESTMLIGIILSSRNCTSIKSRVEEWEKLMDQFSKTLNEWFLCMQTWMYLEVLFSAPDIQRQLPNEARLFTMVDKSWKDIMRRTAKVPLALAAATDPLLLETFTKNNAMLDQIMKCLEAYLETKRVAFPRFYFLSNDELLEILAQTRNPHAVQPHLRKCFDAIARLEFAMKPKERRESEEGTVEGDKRESEGELEMTTDISAMISPENERVTLGKGLKARGNVEDWLSKVEEAMFTSLRKCMKGSLGDFMIRPRTDWIRRHPNQVVLTVSQIMWAKKVHQILESKAISKIDAKLQDFEKENISDLNDSAALTRQNISKLFRKVLCALITIDVHARDTINNMVAREVRRPDAFDWLKMIRYYWDEGIDNCVARMSSASYIYGHEYIGAGGVLVITPLTDRCYLCLMGALQLDLGGAPAGPAGTGKTETTKDLAKSLAIQCVVFNCSEGLDYKMMGRFFSGLVSSGAWCCFDEFNRINIEVLSVIAQQLITIRNAKVAKQKRFMFEGREIKLIATCAVFITMNPGYAGRTELPDNLKALFRPISMMVPDYGLIAEVILYSEGFESSRNLAKKMVQMYKLCSEQLSQQDHYDFGMRAVKSVLVMAGALKRASPDQHEEVTLMCALRDSNLPKFLADDAILFAGILGDLFPGVQLPEKDYAVMEEVIKKMLLQNKLQVEQCQIAKVIQLHETMIVRWGVMLVGPTGGGKTTVLTNLGETLTELHNLGIEDQYFQIVRKYVMNPKALSMGELYGEVNPLTLEWKDGLLAIALRTGVQCTEEDHQWIICDGPVDAVWIENMNTVLDDNKMLCLANSERIKLTPYVHMVFEVENLAQASPATVSRCGMVYVDPSELEWQPYVRTWLEALPVNKVINADNKAKIYDLFHYIDKGFYFIRKSCFSGILQVDISKVAMLCNILQSLLIEPVDNFEDKDEMHNYIVQCFLFCYVWAVGGNLLDDSRIAFERYVKTQFEEVLIDAPLPVDLWDVYIDHKIKGFEDWNKMVPSYKYNSSEPFFETLVPTRDTVRYGYIMEKLIKQNRPVMFTGNTGVGKSVIAKTVLNKLGSSGTFVPFTMNFSAQTSSIRTQEIFESHLERRKKTVLGAPWGKKIIIFIDDVNMPKLDVYGSQPTIELLRQFLDFGGLYDREKMFWKDIRDVVLSTACAPPGGGRNPLTARFTRHFAMLFITTPNDDTLKVIFKSILNGYLEDFVPEVSCMGTAIVNAAVDIYGKVITKLLPTPMKSHYVFNLRDLSKCMQGVLQADGGLVKEALTILKLFYHECLRVFHDRLINTEDRSFFYHLMHEVCMSNFGQPIMEFELAAIIKPPLLLFGDFLNYGAAKENRIYEEIKELDQLKDILYFYLEEYNATARAEMKLVLFTDAAEHVVRIARVLRAERGHALLVGPGGSGRRSLATLAAYINEYKCFGMELTRNYDLTSFHDDLRSLYISTGVKNEDTVFLFTDTQILQEEFLEDINNILNSGEVPNLFENEDYEKVILACRGPAAEAGFNANDRESVFTFFINKIRAKLHLCICMSPVGDVFRRRCRMFPSIVNCCTIDWFVKWPPDALLTVATRVLGAMEGAENVPLLAEVCVLMHESTEIMTERLYVELHRYFYTTPSSYLDLLKLYCDMLDKKRQEILKSRARIANGLTKLYETYEVVGVMENQVKAMAPVLVQKAVEAKEMMGKLKLEEAAADKVKQGVLEDEASALVQAAATQELADDAARDLELAMPAMKAAQDALKSLNKADINELRVFQKPPAMVKFVMEPVCLLLGAKTDWDSAKKVLGESNFLKNLEDYDKDHIKDAMLKKIKVYIDHKDFEPDIVVKVSKVCRSMCLWVRAVDTYAKVFRIVEPKILKQKEAELQMAAVMAVLQAKQAQLAAVEAMLATMQASLQKMLAESAALQADLDLAEARLTRAGKLTQALADEQARWEDSVKNLTNELECTTGNIIVGSGCVAYFGAFPTNYRQELLEKWIDKCNELGILISQTFSMTSVLSDAYTVRCWNTNGLPRDNVSVENGILVTKAGRWPLMIDPQEQANRWIRNMERDNQLQIVKLTDGNYIRVMENSIRLGRPVLIEEIAETLDPTLSPILQKCTFVQGGRLLIHLGDTDIEYDPHFKLYITTKLANPHYLPDICIQVTIVNFTVTLLGLEDQLLAEVVRIERPDLEAQRSELIMRINNDKMQLLAIEDKILRMLFASSGNILDDEELIETLNESKETSAIVVARLLDSETTEKSISIAREKYRPIATRGAVLYFAVSTLSTIDPMYQFSLKYFQLVFNNVIETSEKFKDFDLQIINMLKAITLAVYTNISRGLFEKHKLVYSFLLNMAVYQQANMIPESYWMFFLRGPVGSKVVPEKKPLVPGLTDTMWFAAQHLDETFPKFKGLKDNCLHVIKVSIGTYVQEIKIIRETKVPSTIDFDSRLDQFEKLILLKALKSEALVGAITEYVSCNLGRGFIESSAISLNNLYKDMSNLTPLVFILSSGSDPFGAFHKFATEMGYRERVQSISLGQGQGPIAEKMIAEAVYKGDWVFLQNCHLAASWMLSLEQIVQRLSADLVPPHDAFRLFLSSMPTNDFPVSVLQNSVKVTNEAPKGLRANIKRAFGEMNEEWFGGHPLQQSWRNMVFGLCMFHAVIQERKKFGPLGWTIIYEFSDSDRECALSNLEIFCRNSIILWDALQYITGEITYGGRVTDVWDQRCLKTILSYFFAPHVLSPDYVYSQSGVYYCPKFEKIAEYQQFIEELPIMEEPEIFGMHENANIAFQTEEINQFINNIMKGQAVGSGDKGGVSPDQIVWKLSEEMKRDIVLLIDVEKMLKSHMQKDSMGRVYSLTTVLIQEINRFNKLLKFMHSSLGDLQKAIKGFIVMSDDLEDVFRSFLNNQVPRIWTAKAYNSLKSLGSWVHDLILRINFVDHWMQFGAPPSSWISGLFFPQGLLTGTLQAFSRRYGVSINQLMFDFTPLPFYIFQDDVKMAYSNKNKVAEKEVFNNLNLPEDGIYIHGLFIDAGRWDIPNMHMVDSNPGERSSPLPVFWLRPVTSMPFPDLRYIAPLYKTAARAGVLSTTGHSTNFVIPFLLAASHPQAYWILRGTALITQNTD